MCPGITLQILGVQVRIAVEVGVALDGQRIVLLALPACGGGGPPTPF